ncbi:MAG: hypothetical protein N3G20_02885, partial [Verrucomicrobiae bacterium]|nr:hypothetical protein [Verrucomicrobiae bacterium]
GFHRDDAQDAAVLRANPPPPDKLELRQLRLSGHAITYKGTLVTAFRLEDDKRLAAFAGYDCVGIEIDGRKFIVADRTLAFLAWATVAPNRRVAGGATLELWVQGRATVSLPLPLGMRGSRLMLADVQPGLVSRELPGSFNNSVLTFQADPDGAQGHLYVICRVPGTLHDHTPGRPEIQLSLTITTRRSNSAFRHKPLSQGTATQC